MTELATWKQVDDLKRLVDMMDAAIHLTLKEVDKKTAELLQRIAKAEEDIVYLEAINAKERMDKLEVAVSKLKRGLAEAESGFEFDPHN